ncbi:MAG TPA: hypothetical protein VFZ89_05415 [Solirubrobacteraceae bacterium]
MTRALLAALLATAIVPASAHAQYGPLNDLLALGQAGGQTPVPAPVQRNPEPPLTATPRAQCDANAKPEPGIQGRVPAGAAHTGLWCNARLLGRQGTSGGFRVWRYVDVHGRECAYYDTALLFPLNALKFDGSSLGVAVVDMSDPAHPVQTDRLTELPMLSPHESLNLNAKRGLIAAVLGNPATYPGLVSIYDAHEDCRHPKLQATRLVARLGHESGFSEDGKTFYATGTALEAITAIDVTHPKAPHAVWHGNVVSHGMSLSPDGNRAYVADATAGEMLILDTSEIQARKPSPQAREVSRLTWKSASIPQNAIPFTRDGKPYVLEFDEYGNFSDGDGDTIGAARIIDIADERAPRVIANLRLQVNQPADHEAAANDPGAFSPVQGYAAHYCNVPTRVDPKVVACSFITSGLRVFDISKLTEPKEIAYFVAPTKARAENGLQESSFAMSQPQIVPERREVWYTDGVSGFYVVKIADAVWPKDAAPTKTCRSRRRVSVTVRAPRGSRVRATLAGKPVRVRRRGGKATITASMRGLPRRAVQLVIRVKLRDGRVRTTRKTYHPCRAKKP